MASSRVVVAIPSSVKDVSNWREGKFVYPLLEQLVTKYKVTVTNHPCHCLKAGQCPDPQDHFTHVFIDETIQTTEPESVIAKAGLIYSKGQVVMAGDPKQLGTFHPVK